MVRCMKCGREIGDQQVFCEDCLAEMEKHPVKANATVHLPPRTEVPAPKKKPRKHRELKPEELLRQQRLIIRFLCAALAVSVAAFVLTAVMLLKLIEERDAAPSIGQNYGTVTQSNSN